MFFAGFRLFWCFFRYLVQIIKFHLKLIPKSLRFIELLLARRFRLPKKNESKKCKDYSFFSIGFLRVWLLLDVLWADWTMFIEKTIEISANRFMTVSALPSYIFLSGFYPVFYWISIRFFPVWGSEAPAPAMKIK